MPSLPTDWDILRNALADPIDGFLVAQVDTSVAAADTARRLIAQAYQQQRLAAHLVFHPFSEPLHLILDQSRKITADWPQKPAAPGLLILTDSLPPEAQPQNLANYWRSWNLQREKWFHLPAQVLLLLTPPTHEACSTYADHFYRWVPVKLHLGTPSLPSPPPPDPAQLRQLLQDSFTPDDFLAFCHDHFPEVHRQFTPGQTATQRILALLEHLRTRDQYPQFLQALRRDRPELVPKLQTLPPDPQPKNPPASAINVNDNTIRDHNNLIAGNNNTQNNYYYPPGHTPPPPLAAVQTNLPVLSGDSGLFIGRDTELDWLRRHLLPDRDPGQPLCVAVCGQGGLGKTELALQHGHRHLADYGGGVCWLPFATGSLDLLATGLLSFARDRLLLDIPADNRSPAEKLPWLWAHWRPDGPVLLILDNLDDTTLPAVHALLEAGLPRRFRILATTRLHLTRGWQRLDLDTLAPADSARLFRALAELPDGDLPDLPRLCQRLGHLPLALELVALHHLANKTHLALPELIRDIESQTVAAEALRQLPPATRLTAKLPVQAAFALSWDTLPPDAKLIACRLALFANAPVPAALFLDAFLPDQRPQARCRLTDPLVRLSLIKTVELNSYLLHPLLRDHYRHQLDHEFPAQKPDLSAQVAAAIVKECKKVPQICTLAAQARFAPIAPHAAEAAERLHQHLSADDLAWPGTALASFHQGQSAWKESESWCRRTLALCDTTLGPEHSNTLNSLNNLANLLKIQGNFAEAEPLYRRDLEASERVLGPEHPGTLISLNNFALLLQDQGNLAGAERLHRRALEARERVLGPEHPDTLQSLNNLAFLLYAQGNLAAAEPLFRRALEAQERIFGSEHPNTLTSLNNLAGLLYAQGDLAGAGPLFRRALEAIERTLGPEHPSTLTSLNNLAALLQAQGNFSRAEPLFRRALEAGRRVLPEQNELWLIIEGNWTRFQETIAQSGGQ